MQETAGSIPGWGRSPEEETATHSSILAWEIPWSEEPGGLHTVRHEVARVGHDLVTKPPTTTETESRSVVVRAW